jgi:hypothetical protein
MNRYFSIFDLAAFFGEINLQKDTGPVGPAK